MTVSNEQVRDFWERHPVAAEAISELPGSPAFFRAFDALRESDACEPYAFSNQVHGYGASARQDVLDVGCGNGYVLSRYARQGARVTGVDLTRTALDLTQWRFELEGHDCRLELTDGDRLPFDDYSFDVVCSMGVLHHVQDPQPMVREMYRVLRPGGTVIVMLYHTRSFKRCVLLPLKWLLLARYRGRPFQEVLNANDGEGCPWVRTYTREEARALLGDFEEHEFWVNQLSWRQLFLVPGLGDALAHVLPPSSECWPARTMGWNLYARARRPLLSGQGVAREEADIGR